MGRRMTKRQRGQALVELVLSLPLLVILVAGSVHFGMMFETQQLITNASRLGARRATQPSGDAAAVNSAVATYCQQAGLDPSRLSVQVNLEASTNRAIITVTYQFTTPVEGLLAATGVFFNNNPMTNMKQLQATTIMRL